LSKVNAVWQIVLLVICKEMKMLRDISYTLVYKGDTMNRMASDFITRAQFGVDTIINLYATVTVWAYCKKFGAAKLPGSWTFWIIVVADYWRSRFLYAIEFFADKIPYVDSVWDVIHTFIEFSRCNSCLRDDKSNG